MLSLFDEAGLEPVVAPELEFFLVQQSSDANNPLVTLTGKSGRAEKARQAYGIDAVNEFDPLFEDIYDYCDVQKIDIDTLSHEAGAAQMEINFNHGEALIWPIRRFCLSGQSVRRRSTTLSMPPSWPNPCRISPAVPCICICPFGTKQQAATCL